MPNLYFFYIVRPTKKTLLIESFLKINSQKPQDDTFKDFCDGYKSSNNPISFFKVILTQQLTRTPRADKQQVINRKSCSPRPREEVLKGNKCVPPVPVASFWHSLFCCCRNCLTLTGRVGELSHLS